MKKILIVTLLLTSIVHAQLNSPSKITEVIVYRNGAEVSSESGVKLPAGTTELLIENITTQINPNSLQVAVKSGGNVSLLSATYETNYLSADQLNEKQKTLKDKLDKQNEDLRWAKEQKQIYYDLETVLNENKKLGGANVGLNPNDLATLLELYKTKQYEYNQAFLKFEKMEKELQIEVSKTQNQLNEENAQINKPSGVIKLLVSSASATYADFKCTYLVNNAGWQPIYDLRSEGTNKNVELFYKANVYQNTGYDWDKVKVSISTGNPNQNNNRPVLNPLYVDFYQPYYGGDYKSLEQVQVVSAKKVRIASEEMNMAYAPDVADEEGVNWQNGYQYNAQEYNTTFTTVYDLGSLQSVPSDGKYHLMALENYSLPSTYVYHTVPKLDCGAFLLAKVSNWGQYNLLPGVANIFFEGAYVGQSSINPNVSSDTLLLSMGRDEGIIIKRTEVKDFTSVKTVGSNKKETYAFEIEIRNNKPYAISLEVLDQVPVSNNKDIVVEVEDFGGAKYNEEIGKLEWNVNLAANQTKKIKFVYSVKYPKDLQIIGQK